MAQKSKASSTTSPSFGGAPSFGGGGGFGGMGGGSFGTQAPKEARELSPDELDDRLRREQHREAAGRAADSAFVTEVTGDAAQLAEVRRLALFSRDRATRSHLFHEFYAEQEEAGAAVEVLPAEYVLDVSALLERLHMAVCRREGWDEGTAVEDVIERLEREGRRHP